MVIKAVIRGSDMFDGIFCKLKSIIGFKIMSTQNWYGDPRIYFCTTSAHDLYPYPPVEYSYVEYNLNGYYVNPNEYVIKGRSVNSDYLPVDWDFQGYDGIDWVTLNKSRGNALKRNEFRSFSIKTKKYFLSFRIQSQGRDSYGNWFLCFESIEVYGLLSDFPHGMIEKTLSPEIHFDILELILISLIWS